MGVRILKSGSETLRSANGLIGLNALNHLNGYLVFKSAAPESPVRRSGLSDKACRPCRGRRRCS